MNTRTRFNSFKLSRTVFWLLSTFGQTWKWAELNLLSTYQQTVVCTHSFGEKMGTICIVLLHFLLFPLPNEICGSLLSQTLHVCCWYEQVLYSGFFKWECCLLWEMWKRTKTIKLWLIKPATGGWHKNQQSCGKLQALEILLCEFTTTGNHDIIQC